MTAQRIGVLTVDATFHTELGRSVPQSVKATVVTSEPVPWERESSGSRERVNSACRQAAEAWVAELGAPAFVKLFATTLTGSVGVQGYVQFDAWLLADKVNGGINETGIKRFRRLMEQALRHGYEVDYLPRFGNSYSSIDELMAAVAAAEA